MKPFYILAAFFILFNCSKINAQTTTVCNIIKDSTGGNISKDVPLILYVQDSVSNHQLQIVFPQTIIKKMSFDPRKKLVNQQACITGVVKKYNHQPAIFISSEKQIKISEKPEVNRQTSNE